MPLTSEPSDDFKKRFAAWLRIEPRCRQDDFSQGLEARIADPLWMLSRQWQTGEFQAEDAGSPIRVSLKSSTQPILKIEMGESETAYDINTTPLESSIEQEKTILNYRTRVRIGQEFERQLKNTMQALDVLAQYENILAHLRSDVDVVFPVNLPPLHKIDRATQKFIKFMQARVIDGKAVLAESISTPDESIISVADFSAIITNVKNRFNDICIEPTENLSPAWQPESLKYKFKTKKSITDQNANLNSDTNSANENIQLIANDYRNGELDWYSFTAGNGSLQDWPIQETSHQLNVNDSDYKVTTPTQIKISGTSQRWWAFEDGNTDFGAMDVAKPDLAKMLLMEFALIYGDDWFSVPLPVESGNLVKVDALWVSNVFGEDTLIQPARKTTGTPDERFDIFSISPVNAPTEPGVSVLLTTDDTGTNVDNDADPIKYPLLFIPPASGFRQESVALDEVRFLRDEGANMLWGIEQVVPNGLGRPIAGFDAQRESLERINEVENNNIELLINYAKQKVEAPDIVSELRAQYKKIISLANARLQELIPYKTPTPSQNSMPRYQLTSNVAENWIPFMPVLSSIASTVENYSDVSFRRSKMLRNTEHVKQSNGVVIAENILTIAATDLSLSANSFLWMGDHKKPESIASQSRLLALDEDALLWLSEQTVTRAGLKVQLTKQRTRWVDGSTHVWLGRKVLIAQGEGASGLKFDVLKDVES